MTLADDIITGLFCRDCSGFIDGKAPGYPRSCGDCEEEEED